MTRPTPTSGSRANARRDPPSLTINAANVTLRQLEALVAVAECGGFRASAARLHMTQSAVSQAVLGLERVLSAPLLVRGRGRVVPTALGERVVAHARRALSEVSEIAAAALADSDIQPGSLRLASIRSVAARLVGPTLPTFSARHPRVSVSLWEGTDRELHAWLNAGLVDVGFVGPALDVPADAQVIALAEDPWYALLPKDHALSRYPRLQLRRLAGVPYVMSDSGCEPAVRALFERVGATPDVQHRAVGIDTLMEMVAAGLGWTLVPEMAITPAAPAGTVAVPLDPPMARTVSAVLPAGADAPPAARALVNAVRRRPPLAPNDAAR
ncbi:MAG TPA: LysR family transcriptional regulator [Gemmatimonadaceae bacterium]|nr:LysR family transcriptional regulator [Gemmatimonadaceae bacterium]